MWEQTSLFLDLPLSFSHTHRFNWSRSRSLECRVNNVRLHKVLQLSNDRGIKTRSMIRPRPSCSFRVCVLTAASLGSYPFNK